MLSYNVGRQAAERQHFSTRNLKKKKAAVVQMGSSCETFQQRAIHVFLPRSFLPVSRTVEDITTHLWPPQNTREGGGGDALRNSLYRVRSRHAKDANYAFAGCTNYYARYFISTTEQPGPPNGSVRRRGKSFYTIKKKRI